MRKINVTSVPSVTVYTKELPKTKNELIQDAGLQIGITVAATIGTAVVSTIASGIAARRARKEQIKAAKEMAAINGKEEA